MNETTILTDRQIRQLIKGLRQAFGSETAQQMRKIGISLEETVRLMSLNAKCQEVREERGLSIKDVAAKLEIPQYRLKAVEKGRAKDILPDVLEKYIAFLSLEDWFEQWKEANPKLAAKLIP